MGKIITQVINRFDGATSNDPRSKDASKYLLARHFDAFTYPHKLVPNYPTTALAGEDKTYEIVKYLYADRSGTSYLFGLGVVVGSGKAKVYYHNGTAWQTPNKGESSIGDRNEDVFFHYKGYIYMYGGTSDLKRFDTTSNVDFNDSYQTLSTFVANRRYPKPLYCPIDDCAYFFVNNVVYRMSDTSTWDGAVLTLPANYAITGAAVFNNYLAIAVTTTDDKNKKSVVYLWDRDSSLSTLTERIDFGTGEIYFLDVLDNKLTAIMKNYPKLLVKQANGTTNVIINEITSAGVGITITNDYQVIDNVIYFPMDLDTDAGDRMGIWACDSSGRLYIDTVVEEADSYEGIFNLDGAWYISHSGDGSTDKQGTSYSGTQVSKYKTLFLGETNLNKKLLSVGVMTEPLSSNGKIIAKYALKYSDTPTAVFTNEEDDSTYHEAINIESSGSNLPEFREILLQVESYVGAVITGIVIKYEIIDSNPS